jgi:CheY-like chemotaxis protein
MASAHLADKRILVVEDDELTRDALRLILEAKHYTVHGSANGWEALDHLRHSAVPALILLDLMMPVMDGWQFRRHLTQHAAWASIPVVVFSAAGNIHQEAASLGAAGYLEKPIDLDKLLDTVQRLC